jgi:DNA-binding FadR family transcriptional regulator
MSQDPDTHLLHLHPDYVPRGPTERVVRQLQEECLAAPEGAALGSEEELLNRLQVSRPTLRQATRLLEYQGLMTVRRGPGGGYFARRPDVRSVADAAALFLRSRRTSLAEIVALAHSFSIESAARAAVSTATDARASLGAFAEDIRSQVPEDISSDLFVAQEAVITGLIYEMVGSAPLELLSRVFTRFGIGSRGGNIFEGFPERRTLWRPLRLALVDAIVAGDAALASELASKLNALSAHWVLPLEAAEPHN